MNGEVLVTVVMPAYNGERYIKEAINSILVQTHTNFELIIVEDNSTDNTLWVIEEIKDSRIRLFKNSENRGIAYSTNFGIERSRGKYIALLDDDDIALKRRLEWQVEFLEEHNDIDILGGRSVFIDKDGSFIRYAKEPIYNPAYIKANLLFYNKKFANGTAMIRKSFIVENHLAYRDNCLGMQDYKFYIESSKVGKITSIDNLIHLKRIHEKQETVKQKDWNTKARADLFAQFQRESLKLSGFQLEEDQLQAINELITETPKNKYSKEEVVKICAVFKEILKQAQAMNVDYLEGLEYACKMILGNRILVRADIFGW